MPLTVDDFEQGTLDYWREIDSRSAKVRDRERSFPLLSQRFSSRRPPHFTHSELEEIIRWKYTDARRCRRALDGLATVPEGRTRDLTALVDYVEAADAARVLRGAIPGMDIAGVSAVLAAAKPHVFPVIDVFALTAICHHYDPAWLKTVPRDGQGRFSADEKSYGPILRILSYTCRRAVNHNRPLVDTTTHRYDALGYWEATYREPFGSRRLCRQPFVRSIDGSSTGCGPHKFAVEQPAGSHSLARGCSPWR